MRIHCLPKPVFIRAFEGIEEKREPLERFLAENRDKEWNTPDELNNLFGPQLKSDQRILLGKMSAEDNPWLNRVKKASNYINYIGDNAETGWQYKNDLGKLLIDIFPDAGVSKKEINFLIERLVDEMTPEEYEAYLEYKKLNGTEPNYIFIITDKMLRYIADIVRIWIGTRESYVRPKLLVERIKNDIGGEAGDRFEYLYHSNQIRTPQQLMHHMLYARGRINDAPNDTIATQFEYLEAALQIALALMTNDLGDESLAIYELWQDEADRLIEEEENSVQPNIREEWEEMPEEYNFSTKDILNSAFKRENHLKLMIFIALAKLYVPR